MPTPAVQRVTLPAVDPPVRVAGDGQSIRHQLLRGDRFAGLQLAEDLLGGVEDGVLAGVDVTSSGSSSCGLAWLDGVVVEVVAPVRCERDR